MDRRLAESYVNRDDHRVLGVRLHPYCLYDVFFLTLDQNPLLLGGKEVTTTDLQSAVVICSTPPERLLAARRITWRKRLWMRLVRRFANWEAELLKFMAYREDFDSRPVFWQGDEGGSMRAPWVLSISAFLEDHSNMTEREIMTAPLGKMLWKSAALAEQLGVTKSELMSEEEEEAIKEMGIDING